MNFKNHFSKQAADYAMFRPRYPREMFKYLGSVVPSTKFAWDCATGNGQAAVELASVFERVIATDASEKQIANAEQHDHVEYRVAPAENSGIQSGTVDLTMVAQALHWFDLPRFYEEVRRVLKNSGVLAASAYKFLHITPEVDHLINHRYYDKVVGPFWPPERMLVERFEELPFPFPEIRTPSFEMTAQWSMEHLLGYLRSWSSTQRFIAANNRDPLAEIAGELHAVWGDPNQSRRVAWPLILRVGIKDISEPPKG
jgi:ubiquinone/menaquinone biosynthesis C-methylase UbiE